MSWVHLRFEWKLKIKRSLTTAFQQSRKAAEMEKSDEETFVGYRSPNGIRRSHCTSAEDLPVKAAPPPPVAPIYSWTGYYIGVHAGGCVVRHGLVLPLAARRTS